MQLLGSQNDMATIRLASQLVRRPACPVRTRRSETARLFPRCSPKRLLAAPDRCPEGARREFLTKPTSRNGLSLPRSGCPFPGHLCGIEAPDLLLRRPVGYDLPARSAVGSFPRFRFPGFGRDQRPRPVADRRSDIPTDSSGLAPLRDFFGPSDSPLDRVPLPEACLRETSDFVHSPVVELFKVPRRITACDSLRFS